MIYLLDQVTKHYGTREGPVRALDNVSFSVNYGERVALIGKSGVGKTTLFRLLNATLRPTSGVLRFDGSEVRQMTWRELRLMRRTVGTVYQQHYLVPSLTVMDNALCGKLGQWSFWQTLRGTIRPSKLDLREAEHVLESVGLADKRQARADTLSGGQQQRLAIARVLMQSPEVILADEPVASLDPSLADSIINLLLKLADEGKRTLVVALHDLDLALRYFPRIVALSQGSLAFDAETACLSRTTLDEFYSRDRAVLTPPIDTKDESSGLRCSC